MQLQVCRLDTWLHMQVPVQASSLRGSCQQALLEDKVTAAGSPTQRSAAA